MTIDYRLIRASAPTRIDLAGATLDIWPIYLFHQNAQTLNAAISLRAHAEIVPRSDGKVRLVSIDMNTSLEVSAWQELAHLDGLPLTANFVTNAIMELER